MVNGNCSSASVASIFMDYALEDSEGFYKKTGINPIITQDGKEVLNTQGIFTFTMMNSQNDATLDMGNNAIIRNTDGSISVNPNGENPQYSTFAGINVDQINETIKQFDLGQPLQKTELIEGFIMGDSEIGYSTSELTEVAQKVKQALDRGEIVMLGITPQRGPTEISLYDGDKYYTGIITRGHEMRVYGSGAERYAC